MTAHPLKAPDLKPTPTQNSYELNHGGFPDLATALDYAARGETGYNVYDRRGRLSCVLTYRKLREDALAIAAKLRSLGLEKGARVALMGETRPDTAAAFFGCQYAGFVPVTLPVAIHTGSRDAFIAQLRAMIQDCGGDVALASSGFLPYVAEACEGLSLRFEGTVEDLPQATDPDRTDPDRTDPDRTGPDNTGPAETGASPGAPSERADLAYLQYTSGSTRFPRGVMVTHEALMTNLRGMLNSCEVTNEDRCTSWLPWYHDMGLVGLVLAPMAGQRSVDFLPTQDFVMAPLSWLSLISLNKSTISFSPPFGFELCNRRVRKENLAQFDLSSWRVAGVGAEPIRPETLLSFVDTFRASGFQDTALHPSYGMAECSLALTFPGLGSGLVVDTIDAGRLEEGAAVPVDKDDPNASDPTKVRHFVECGSPMPGHRITIRDTTGKLLQDRQVGQIFAHGPSNMSGYFDDEEATRKVLAEDGWLNTGDLGYWTGSSLVITGRQKDLIIVKGRNVWPQDLEVLAEEELQLPMGRALAFAVEGPDGDQPVIIVQSREADSLAQAESGERLRRAVRRAFGLDAAVEFVGPGVLPRTSSGKLSRSQARRDYKARLEQLDVHTLSPFAAATLPNSAGLPNAASSASSANGAILAAQDATRKPGRPS